MVAPPVVSVVVVAFDARDDVLRCLASVEREVRIDHEVVLVDDGSHDGTTDAVHALQPRCRVLRKPRNEGLVAGRNSALELVRGRVVLMLDADTEVRRGAVERLVEELDERPDVGLVGPKLLHPDGRLQLSCRRWPPAVLPLLRRGPLARVRPEPRMHRRHLMMDDPHDRARAVVWVAGAAQAYRADLPAQLGPYDRRVSSYGGEDLDWCLRVWRAGLQVRYVPDAEIVHVSQQVTRRSAYGADSRRALRDFYYLQLKHRGLRRDPRLREAQA